jgi:hypothetical protein
LVHFEIWNVSLVTVFLWLVTAAQRKLSGGLSFIRFLVGRPGCLIDPDFIYSCSREPVRSQSPALPKNFLRSLAEMKGNSKEKFGQIPLLNQHGFQLKAKSEGGAGNARLVA